MDGDNNIIIVTLKIHYASVYLYPLDVAKKYYVLDISQIIHKNLVGLPILRETIPLPAQANLCQCMQQNVEPLRCLALTEN